MPRIGPTSGKTPWANGGGGFFMVVNPEKSHRREVTGSSGFHLRIR
jgi:hypothetical protein